MASPSEPFAGGKVENGHREGDDADHDVEDVEHRTLLTARTG
jgi:hypothetical protein